MKLKFVFSNSKSKNIVDKIEKKKRSKYIQSFKRCSFFFLEKTNEFIVFFF
jgi:hypothetical protein